MNAKTISVQVYHQQWRPFIRYNECSWTHNLEPWNVEPLYWLRQGLGNIGHTFIRLPIGPLEPRRCAVVQSSHRRGTAGPIPLQLNSGPAAKIAAWRVYIGSPSPVLIHKSSSFVTYMPTLARTSSAEI